MSATALSEILTAAVTGASAQELPSVIGQLEAAKAAAWVRLTGAAPSPQQETQPDRMLTPEQAAELARVKPSRIYAWARGARWAVRPSRKCLRVSEGAFRRWLLARTPGA